MTKLGHLFIRYHSCHLRALLIVAAAGMLCSYSQYIVIKKNKNFQFFGQTAPRDRTVAEDGYQKTGYRSFLRR
jgi:hypothetical protein